jgi:NAD-dependent dihydropyrimidine dehydrogenase PreA subunit
MIYMTEPTIDNSKCTGCGSCVQVCPVSVFKMKGKKSTVADPGACIGCRACEASCPASAIKVSD